MNLCHILFILCVAASSAFYLPAPVTHFLRKQVPFTRLSFTARDESSTEEEEPKNVVELGDDDPSTKGKAVIAPFLSQGGIADDYLNPDLSDPKQARVIIYIVLSLLPVLFLIPLILGSRDFIPQDALPPVIL
jgi:hypothetical protein